MSPFADEIVLASASPRRRQLLDAAGFRFRTSPSRMPEPPPDGFASPEAYVTHLAWLKAMAVAKAEPGWVLGADTACALGDEVLGKATDRADAKRILKKLQATCHRTLTGVCIVAPASLGRLAIVDCVGTKVWMRKLSDEQLEAYLASDAWCDKAGAYGIQDCSDPFVERIEGSFSNVVGLPIERIAELLTWIAGRGAAAAGQCEQTA